MALASMAGRAMAGTTGGGGARLQERIGVPGKKGKDKPPADLQQAPLGGPITSIAAELRELASLRDAGILTQDEFIEQKQRLLPRDP